jgi:hypothetical protein
LEMVQQVQALVQLPVMVPGQELVYLQMPD